MFELIFCSTVLDVDPGTILGSRPTEPVTDEQNVAGQTAPEQPVAQPIAVPTTERVDEDPARDRAETSAPTRGDGSAGNPPPSSVREEENKAPSPALVEENRAPSPTPVEALAQEGAPDHGKGPMIPATVVGDSAEGKETQAVSDDKVEEIQGRPHDGRQHI